jgi:hypothetical protein
MKFVICHLSFVILFLILPFLNPTTISAINPEASFDISSTTIQGTTNNSELNLLEKILAWIFGLFAKTDYTIKPSRSLDEKIKDMTNYGGNPGEDDTQKHSFIGSRISDSNSQICLKGNVIQKVILSTSNNTELSQICSDTTTNECIVKPLDITAKENLTNCHTITINDLGQYFVQLNQQFYCDSNNKLTDIEETIKNKFPDETATIPVNEYDCYQGIYDDLYLTPKDPKQDDENTKKMMKTPIPANDQDSNESANKIEKKLNQSLSPDGTNAGLSGLRPENDK